MEATGYSRWFEGLLAELGFEVWIGECGAGGSSDPLPASDLTSSPRAIGRPIGDEPVAKGQRVG